MDVTISLFSGGREATVEFVGVPLPSLILLYLVILLEKSFHVVVMVVGMEREQTLTVFKFLQLQKNQTMPFFQLLAFVDNQDWYQRVGILLLQFVVSFKVCQEKKVD